MSLLTHMERWKDIEGYEGLYKVSSCGRVKSLKFGKERILKPIKTRGYLQTELCKDGKRKNFYVHRLVAKAFISNNNYPEVNHKDEIKTNNYVSNLEWCDRQYNNNYGTRIEKISNKILCVETNTVYQSSWEAHRQTGAHQGSIIHCCKGNRKTVKGFHWQYAE